MKALYVTERRAIGDSAFRSLLSRLEGAPELTVQLRERGTADRECREWAQTARRSLGSEVPLFVNRRFDIALSAGADGVHLPADGLPLPQVRAHTPRGFRVGVSVHSAQEASAAIAEGADLIVLGPIFETPSKRSLGPPLGPAALEGLPLLASHRSEVFAIGGVDESGLDRLAPYRDRISGVAAIRLFQEASDPRGVVERIAAR